MSPRSSTGSSPVATRSPASDRRLIPLRRDLQRTSTVPILRYPAASLRDGEIPIRSSASAAQHRPTKPARPIADLPRRPAPTRIRETRRSRHAPRKSLWPTPSSATRPNRRSSTAARSTPAARNCGPQPEREPYRQYADAKSGFKYERGWSGSGNDDELLAEIFRRRESSHARGADVHYTFSVGFLEVGDNPSIVTLSVPLGPRSTRTLPVSVSTTQREPNTPVMLPDGLG